MNLIKKYTVIEPYKGRQIAKYPDGAIVVVDPELGTEFVVALDDSKTCGHRAFDPKYNTVENAKGYIDWITKAKKPPAQPKPKPAMDFKIMGSNKQGFCVAWSNGTQSEKFLSYSEAYNHAAEQFNNAKGVTV